MAEAPESKGGLPVLEFKSDRHWEAWLAGNHAGSKGLWVRLSRKARTGPAKPAGDAGRAAAKPEKIAPLTYDQAVLTALCHGWIDGQKAAGDASAWLQKFTPRGHRSVWSKLNRERVAALSEAGRMRPAGVAAVERAKKGGQWEAAYDTPKTATVSPEFQAELDKSKAAAAFFATLNSANRYAILWRIQTAKKPETKTLRIKTFIAMLKRKETLHPRP
jgi:uncharacterized protein YdeI (YjbR/CyaY-like superfamily)